MSLEDQVIEAAGFTPAREYKSRQDYLAALVEATADIQDDEFEKLPEEVALWINDAAKARRQKKEIPEFPDLNYPVVSTQEIDGELEAVIENAPYPEPKPRKQRKPKVKMTGKFNRFGVAEGTRADMAIKLFEKGATMKEIKETVGDTKYNLFRWLGEQGHLCTKENKVFRVVHKDDLPKEE